MSDYESHLRDYWHEPSSTNGFDDAIDESDSSITLRQEAAAPAAALETPLKVTQR